MSSVCVVHVIFVLELLTVLQLVQSQGNVTQDEIRTWTVRITPRSQKVAEGSAVLFTCESSLPVGVRIAWTKPVKPIDEERDSVQIIQISQNSSVLRVEEAHVKKHRRTFRCTVSYDDPVSGAVLDKEVNTALKVIPTAKLRMDFPKVHSEMGPSISPPRPWLVPLVCEVDGHWSKSEPSFTWIKDSVRDLGLEKENWLNDDMRILYVDPTSPGQYQCAVFYKKGSLTVYGNVVSPGATAYEVEHKKNCTSYNGTTVQHGEMFYPQPCEYCECDDGKPSERGCAMIDCAPIPIGCVKKEGGACCEYSCDNVTRIVTPCRDYKGNTVLDGDLYRPGDEPCETCLCSDGMPSLCSTAMCDAPPCPRYISLPDTCCGFECLDCLSFHGTYVNEGDVYRPSADPCETCVCERGQPSQCFNVACLKPTLPCPDPIQIPGACCKFTCGNISSDLADFLVDKRECRAYNGTKIAEGQWYNPDRDPCVTCTCRNGRADECLSVSCIPPPMPCANPRPVPGECCKFSCEKPAAVVEKGCVAYNGSTVLEGRPYNPDIDPCKTCTCQDGRPVLCMNVACMPPPMPCDNPKPVPGKCCMFTCDNSTDAANIKEKECRAYNGTRIAEGQWYNPDRDPCVTCTCRNGRADECLSVSCIPPPMPCANPRPVPGECCKFTCEKPAAVIEKGCVAYNGSRVVGGQRFNPYKDPCVTCTCQNGFSEDCFSMSCVPPPMPCDDPRPVPGKCCKFTCEDSIDPESIKEKGCMSFNGSMVPFGSMYQIGEDPCRICECLPDHGACMMVACARPPMPCAHPRQVSNECCSFTCNESVPVHTIGEDGYHMTIPITPHVQQIGAENVIVHLEQPNMKQFEIVTNATVYFSRQNYLGRFDVEGGMDHVIVRGLNQSQTYKVWAIAIAKLRNSDEKMATRKLERISFTLDPKETPGLNLQTAIGKVYESRGAVSIGAFSIPHPFKPITMSDTIHVTLNLYTFHRVEISSFTDRPCPKMECGLLRFYMYNMTGQAHNVMSLMFSEDMDFQWAKAHL